MTKNKNRLNHALHNEEVCKYLEVKKSDYGDWVITTAFYSALQFVSYKLFPIEVQAISGKKTQLQSIDDLANYNNPKKISKHHLLSDLVDKHCNQITEDYDWLLDMSMNARYNNYLHSPEIAGKAINLLQKIKSFCLK